MEIHNITSDLLNGHYSVELIPDESIEVIIEMQKKDEDNAKIIYNRLNSNLPGHVGIGNADMGNAGINVTIDDDAGMGNVATDDARIDVELSLGESLVGDDDEEENNEEYIDSMILNINDGDIISNIYEQTYV
jgi:hypothetical protein